MSITYDLTIDLLTPNSVSILSQKKYHGENLGTPIRTAYDNSASHRLALKNAVPDNVYDAIILIWGEVPTIPNVPEINISK